ncbi:MAG: AraC family transcriptional regulator [Opitutales bacterium]
MIALQGPYSIHILNADDVPRLYPWTKPERRLTWYLLVLSLAGKERIQVGETFYDIDEGESYLIPPEVRATLSSRRGSRPLWIHFEVRWDEHRGRHPDAIPFADDWDRRRRFAQPSPSETWGVELPVPIPPALRGLFAETIPPLIRQWKNGSPLDILRSEHELSGLLLSLVSSVTSRQAAVQPHSNLAERFRTAERLARENLGQNFGVTEFAAAAGFSRSRFSVLYRQHKGIPPGEHLRRLRLHHAETLLKDTRLPVIEIAAMAGYHDPSVFGRIFRKHHGISPARWREQSAEMRRQPEFPGKG